MTETEAKNLLYTRIKYNLLSNGRNADEDKVKDICMSWWIKCKFHVSKSAEAWECCFTKAEDRKQGLIGVYDFTLELDAFIPPRGAGSKLEVEDLGYKDDTATKEFSLYVSKCTEDTLKGINCIKPPKELHGEYIKMLGTLDEVQLAWWLENVGDVRNNNK